VGKPTRRLAESLLSHKVQDVRSLDLSLSFLFTINLTSDNIDKLQLSLSYGTASN
jgi:hypothetical protein